VFYVKNIGDCVIIVFLIFKIRKEFPSIGGVKFIFRRQMNFGVVFLIVVAVSRRRKDVLQNLEGVIRFLFEHPALSPKAAENGI
jgi:hypothetical protein